MYRGQIVRVHPSRPQQLVHQGEDQQAVRPRGDPDPLVRDRRVPGANRVHRHHLRAALLEPREPELDGVAVVILGDAEQHEPSGVLPIGLAELPERAADRVEPGRRHVDGTEPSVRRMVGGAEAARPPAGEGLTLVASGEERELARIGLAQGAKPLHGEPDRLLPGDLPELAAPAFAGAQEGAGEPRRRVVLHDAGGTLRAQHPAVHRMIRVALDVADLPVLEMHPDPAPARAHVARGGPDLVADRSGVLDRPAFHRASIFQDGGRGPDSPRRKRRARAPGAP